MAVGVGLEDAGMDRFGMDGRKRGVRVVVERFRGRSAVRWGAVREWDDGLLNVAAEAAFHRQQRNVALLLRR
jgi:hypothetical protein